MTATTKMCVRCLCIGTGFALLFTFEQWLTPANSFIRSIPLLRAVCDNITVPPIPPWLNAVLFTCLFELLWLRWRQGGTSTRSILLLAIVQMGFIFSYFRTKEEIHNVTYNTLVFPGACALAVGLSVWQGLNRYPKRDWIFEITTSFSILLAISAMVQTQLYVVFQYRGAERRTGFWTDPNTFGLLMGTGLVLAVGLLNYSAAKNGGGTLLDQCRRHYHATGCRKLSTLIQCLGFGIYLLCVIALSIGLIASYSRGAWLAASFGMIYMAQRCWKWKKRNCTIAIVIGLSTLLLGFWAFRDTQKTVLRRVFSAANINDFSWRNRVVSYEGALQMMVDKPLLGFGWNRRDKAYRNLYHVGTSDASVSFILNDYAVIGTTLGLPVLTLFLAYVYSTFIPFKSNRIDIESTQIGEAWLKTTCRAGAIGMLVGFWFDGGLFKVVLAVPFWVLLELGRSEHGAIESTTGTSSPSAAS